MVLVWWHRSQEHLKPCPMTSSSASSSGSSTTGSWASTSESEGRLGCERSSQTSTSVSPTGEPGSCSKGSAGNQPRTPVVRRCNTPGNKEMRAQAGDACRWWSEQGRSRTNDLPRSRRTRRSRGSKE